MKLELVIAAMIATAPVCAAAQDVQVQTSGTEIKKAPVDPPEETVDKRAVLPADVKIGTQPDTKTAAVASADQETTNPADYGYTRPDRRQRFKTYLNDLAGPVALGAAAGTAGLLTLRNSPKEWGDKGDGFVRRFGNVMAKNAIRRTTIYGLDEALKVDSSFYRSRDRSLAGRLRNSVFSAVTARDRKGKRVIGVPAIAGSLLSQVTASSRWYPSRYDYVHGLKGGAISLGLAAGMNLFREFVWKR